MLWFLFSYITKFLWEEITLFEITLLEELLNTSPATGFLVVETYILLCVLLTIILKQNVTAEHLYEQKTYFELLKDTAMCWISSYAEN